MSMMHKNRSVNPHSFAMIPRADIPRASFDRQFTHKTTFDAGQLIPVYVDEVLPGDTFKLRMTAFARLSTPLFPVMDNMKLSSFFFFVPNRLVWSNWVKFMGEQDNPADSISYVLPTITSPASGYAVNSIFDYMGLPTVGQVQAAATVTHSSLPLRAYNLIYNEWFRDENLQNSVVERKTDGGDVVADFALLRRGKRADYFTSALPWPQKGGNAVSIPLGTTAPVISQSYKDGADAAFLAGGSTNFTTYAPIAVTGGVKFGTNGEGLFADLSAASAATINQLRQSFQIQRLLERDARGGTRYTEIVRSHFGVVSPDARLQRPEYLGGGITPVLINPIAQTSGTGLTGGTSPLANLAGVGTVLANGHGFTQSFTEHGHVIGIVCIDADLTYQQGLNRMWSRSTRYDFYFPAFAMLGEQAILNKEIYCRGDANDALVFGYQERLSLIHISEPTRPY